MITFWSQLRRYLLPTPSTITLLWGAALIFALLSAVAAMASLDLDDPQMLPVLMGTGAGPLLMLPVLVAALREPRAGPRAFLWWLLVLLVLAASLAMLLPLTFRPEGDARALLTLFITCCLPPLLLAGLVALFFTLKSFPEMQRFLRAARYQRAIQMIQARGEASFADIGQELSLSPAQAGQLLSQLAASGDLMAYLDAETQRVYSAATLAEKQRILLAVIQARGQVRLDELPAELGAPARLVQQWVVHLAQRGQLHGYVDWQAGRLFSRDANYLQDKEGCPHCGGQLDLVGQGLVRCAHCGVEVFL